MPPGVDLISYIHIQKRDYQGSWKLDQFLKVTNLICHKLNVYNGNKLISQPNAEIHAPGFPTVNLARVFVDPSCVNTPDANTKSLYGATTNQISNPGGMSGA